MTVRLPNSSQRTVLVGRTGTGKTVAGLWHLSNYNMDKPWIVIDFKIDEHINSIEKANHVDLGYIPSKKDHGLFVVHPHQTDTQPPNPKEQSPVEKYLWQLWERENVGLFCDEAFMFGNMNGLNAILTQGRSKRIPAILCTQRPVWVSRYAFSEADFVQVFSLNDADDRRRVEGFVPIDFDAEDRLGDHQSFYYDIAKDRLVRFNPVPNMDQIRGAFDKKLYTRRRWL